MAIAFPLSLAFEDDGFGFRGAVRDVAIGEVGWTVGFSIVALGPNVPRDGDPFGFNSERGGGDFGTDELGPLGKVSAEEKLIMSLGGFWALAFFFILFSFLGNTSREWQLPFLCLWPSKMMASALGVP